MLSRWRFLDVLRIRSTMSPARSISGAIDIAYDTAERFLTSPRQPIQVHRFCSIAVRRRVSSSLSWPSGENDIIAKLRLRLHDQRQLIISEVE